MKNIKLVNILSICCCLLFLNNAFSQVCPPRDKGHKAELKAELDLSPEQEAKIKSIREKYKPEIQAIRSDEQLEPRDKMAKLKSVKTQIQAETDLVFTTAQKAKLEAQKAEFKEERKSKKEAFKEDKRAMHEEMKAYKKTHMMPTLKAQRLKLEDEISSADQLQIEALREKFKAHKAELKDIKETRKGMAHGEVTEAQKAEWKAKKEAAKPDHEEARILVEKYEVQINRLMDEIAEDRAQWKEDMKAIKAKHVEESGMNHKENHRSGPHGKRPHADKKMEFANIHFLLMNPNEKEHKLEEKGNKKTGKLKASNSINGLSVYPNPATNSNTIKYELEQSGTVNISLFNQLGQKVRTIFDGFKEAGIYSENVSLRGLEDASYYYVITDPEGKTTKSFIKINK